MVEKHLTFEEMLQFNAMSYDEARKGNIAAHVTSHVRTCPKCRKALATVQNTERAILGYRSASAKRAVEHKEDRVQTPRN